MQFDEQRLRDALHANPEAVRQFFTESETGVSARFKGAIDRVATGEFSLLMQRAKTLGDHVARNEQRIEAMTKRLDVERERLLLQMYRMELAIGRMQTQLGAIENLQPIPPLVSARRND